MELDSEKVLEYYAQQNFRQVYLILRRIYDRLPFQEEAVHGEFIGYFVRSLLELKKERELEFYGAILHKRWELSGNQELGFALASVAPYLKWLGSAFSERLLRDLLSRKELNRELRFRATMLLAHQISGSSDKGPTIELIQSLEGEPENPRNRAFLEIWRCVVLGYLRSSHLAVPRLEALISTLDPDREWYAHFMARFALVRVNLDAGSYQQAAKLIVPLQRSLRGKSSLISERSVVYLKDQLTLALTKEQLTTEKNPSGLRLTWRGNSATILKLTPLLPIAVALFSAESVRFSKIQRLACGGEERATAELEKFQRKMSGLGLPEDCLVKDGTHYRFLLKTNLRERSL